jgi:hypothetical protein
LPLRIIDDVAIGAEQRSNNLLTSSRLFLSFCSVTPIPFTGKRKQVSYSQQGFKSRSFRLEISRRSYERRLDNAGLKLRDPRRAASRCVRTGHRSADRVEMRRRETGENVDQRAE